MNERAKITASHLARHAVVYLRQSSAAQVEHNRESTERQYALASKARELGWPAERIAVIDEDLGVSGGELRRGLPVGFVWGEEEGEVCFHPDEAVCTAIRQIFAQFAETGSARRVWLWFRSEGLKFPLQMHQGGEIRWVEASYTAIHQVLTNPVYAGAYVYGRTRHEIVLDASGGRKKRVRHLPRAEWQVLIPEHHPGFIDWQTYEANQERIARNTKPGPHQAGGAVREGGALLQGLARCGHCGHRLHTHYRGRNASPGYHCPGKVLVENRGVYCLNIGGIQIDEAVTRTFVAALEPAGFAATLAAAERLKVERKAALK